MHAACLSAMRAQNMLRKCACGAKIPFPISTLRLCRHGSMVSEGLTSTLSRKLWRRLWHLVVPPVGTYVRSSRFASLISLS
eukprot:2705568-Amphidinium_carterae.2